MTALQAFLDATVRTATPLLLAAAGELIVERAGIINIGLEGIVLSGAFGSLLGATHGGIAGGLVGAIVGGLAMALLFLVFVVSAGADQVVTGTAVTLFAVGVTGTLYRALFGSGGAGLTIPTMRRLPIPVLHRIPLVGAAFFAQPLLTYVAFAVVAAIAWWMYRTHGGLALRAVGEAPAAAAAAGVSVRRVRTLALAAQGILGGLAGGVLVLAQAGTFAEGMSAGRGFIAIAIVVLGRWHPIGIGVATLLFGAASALQYLLQSLGTTVPYQLLLAVPYVLTLGALAGLGGRARAPAALARRDAESS